MLMLQIAPMMSSGRTEVFGDVYSFRSGALPSGATYARSGSQLVVGPDKVYVERTVDQPPFNYDLQTGALIGLFMRDRTYTNRFTHDNHNPPNLDATKWSRDAPVVNFTPNAAWGAAFTSIGSVFSQQDTLNSDTSETTTTGAHAKGLVYLVVDPGNQTPQQKWDNGTSNEVLAASGPTFQVDYSTPGSGVEFRIQTFGTTANLEYWGQFVIQTSDTNLDIFDIPISGTVSAGVLTLDVADQTFPIGEVTLTTEDGSSTNTQAITVTGGGGYEFDWADFTNSSGDHVELIRFGEGTQNPPPTPGTKRDATGLGLYPGAPDQTTWTDDQFWKFFHEGFNTSNAVDPYVKIAISRFHWDQIETSEGVYDWTDVDAFQTKAKSKGLKWGISLWEKRFGGSGRTPSSMGLPAYIRNDHVTYGGSSGGLGGMYQTTRTGAGSGLDYFPIKWNANLVTKAIALNEACLARYKADTDFVLFFPAPVETATPNASTDGPGYTISGYETQLKRVVDSSLASSGDVVPVLLLNFIHTSNISNMVDYCFSVGMNIGSPDLIGNKQHGVGNYYSIWEDNMATATCPDIYIATQNPTFDHLAINEANPNLEYSVADCWDVFDGDWTVDGYKYGKCIWSLAVFWDDFNVDQFITQLKAVAPNFGDGDR